MTAKQRRLKVFLCHAKDDKPKVRKLYHRLCADGIDAWLDENELVGGQDWEREIREAVRNSDVVIICYSKKFNQKGYRQKEVSIAVEEAELLPKGEIYIIPARLEECDVLVDLQHLQWVDVFEKDGYDKLLRALHQRASKIGAILPVKRSGVSEPLFHHFESEKLVSDAILRNWMGKHSLTANPFGDVNIRTFPIYPVGAARPDQWEAFLDPAPLFAHCQTAEDAQALTYLLQKECLPLEKDTVNRGIFPVRIFDQQIVPSQLPLFTLAHSAAQAWVNILSSNPDALLKLPPAKQNVLLELLCWSVGSNKTVIDLLQVNGLKEHNASCALVDRIHAFKNEFSSTNVPPQAVLFSWLKISPFDLHQIYLILFVDSLLLTIPIWWFEQFNSLVSTLFLDGIAAKALASTSLPTLASLQDIKLSWSDTRLKQSLDGQFDAAIDPDERAEMGVATRFHELFGPGVIEEKTTQRLISASNHSLAHMLTLGNRLLQEHCNRAATEKYLSIDELEDILKTA